MVLVEGDTTTNLGAALAAFYAGVPVAHVEAGLRSGDVRQPFPEEMHRVLVDRLVVRPLRADDRRAPEPARREPPQPGDVLVVGNTVVDALLMTLREIARRPVRAGTQQDAARHRAPARELRQPALPSICEAIRNPVRPARRI